MSAGISLMYRLSGGCAYTHSCESCGYLCLASGEETSSFGKRSSSTYYCDRHPEKKSPWKANYLACRYYRDQKDQESVIYQELKKNSVSMGKRKTTTRKKHKGATAMPVFCETETGQYSFL